MILNKPIIIQKEDTPCSPEVSSFIVEMIVPSRKRILLEREFDREVPEAKRTAFAEKLFPLIDNVFSIYDLTDDFFAQSPEYDLLYSELTGAVILYLEEYGI